MFITLGIIAYNEENSIGGILSDIVAQDYDHGNIEVVLVDCASTDKTRSIMEAFAAKASKYGLAGVVVADNPEKTQPSGWNVVLRNYHGEALIRVDAHASIPKDFVSNNVRWLDTGEDVVGGCRPNDVENPTAWKNTLYLAETSMFGSSIAPYRNNPGKTYVKSMFHAAYRRRVFDKVGEFNPNLIRTEDNEMHYRIRQAGFKLMFTPQIVSYQHIRSSLTGMLKQKYSNGYWIALTTGVCPGCLSLYHYVPFVFVMAIILTWPLIALYAALFSGVNLMALLAGIGYLVYAVLCVVMSVAAVVRDSERRNITCVALPFLFVMLHISYGVGTLAGCIKLPGWRKGLK